MSKLDLTAIDFQSINDLKPVVDKLNKQISELREDEIYNIVTSILSTINVSLESLKATMYNLVTTDPFIALERYGYIVRFVSSPNKPDSFKIYKLVEERTISFTTTISVTKKNYEEESENGNL